MAAKTRKQQALAKFTPSQLAEREAEKAQLLAELAEIKASYQRWLDLRNQADAAN